MKWAEARRSRHTFLCNNFANCKSSHDLHPLLYFLGDPAYANMSTYQAGGNSENLLEDIAAHFPYTTIFTSSAIAKAIDSYASASLSIGKKDLRIMHSPFRGGNLLGPFDYEICNGLEHFQNILVLMLQVAIFLGFTDINLYGFEFSSILTYPLQTGWHHFYSRQNENQWGDCKDSDITGVDQLEFFRSCFFTLAQLKNIRDHADSNGVKISNYTPGSLLKIFDSPKHVYDRIAV